MSAIEKAEKTNNLKDLRASQKQLRDLFRKNSKASFGDETYYRKNVKDDLEKLSDYLNENKKNNLKSTNLKLFQKYIKFFGIKRKGLTKSKISNAVAKKKLEEMLNHEMVYSRFSALHNSKSPSDVIDVKQKNKGKQTSQSMEFPDIYEDKTVKKVKVQPFLNRIETIFTTNNP